MKKIAGSKSRLLQTKHLPCSAGKKIWLTTVLQRVANTGIFRATKWPYLCWNDSVDTGVKARLIPSIITLNFHPYTEEDHASMEHNITSHTSFEYTKLPSVLASHARWSSRRPPSVWSHFFSSYAYSLRRHEVIP